MSRRSMYAVPDSIVLVVICEMHKDLRIYPGSLRLINCSHHKFIFLLEKYVPIITTTWFQVCRSKATKHSCRFRHCETLYWVLGARPTNGISIKFESRSKFEVLWFKMWWNDHDEILRKSRQCYCRGVYKRSLWSAEYVMNKSIAKYHWISNLIEISLVGWWLGHCYYILRDFAQEAATQVAPWRPRQFLAKLSH